MPLNSTAETAQMKLALLPERRVFRVSELNSELQALFQARFRSIWVAGEVSGCRLAPSGHHYFCLKDQQAQVKCVLFKSAARFSRFKPADGLAVLARGNLDVFESRGEYQLIVETLEPQGAGALQLAFEQLKKKLAAEGLFDPKRKRALPKLPKRIGIVTSPAGAVIRDILQVLDRRFQGVHIRLFPTLVQGDGSVDQLCRALNYFSESRWADLVILARGGGSLEDLWSFNEERVARAISASSVPTISAIGHETDFTIADFVADCRAPTPSAAAEMVICTRESLLEQLAVSRTKAIQAIRYRLLIFGRILHQRGTERAAALVQRAVSKRAQRVDDLDYRLRQVARRRLEFLRRRLVDVTRRFAATDVRLRLTRSKHRQELLTNACQRSMKTTLSEWRRRHEALDAHLTQLSPLAVLGRGYAIVEDANKHILRSADEASLNEKLQVRLHRGELDAVVTAVRPPT